MVLGERSRGDNPPGCLVRGDNTLGGDNPQDTQWVSSECKSQLLLPKYATEFAKAVVFHLLELKYGILFHSASDLQLRCPLLKHRLTILLSSILLW